MKQIAPGLLRIHVGKTPKLILPHPRSANESVGHKKQFLISLKVA
jgi:hypothetical protein